MNDGMMDLKVLLPYQIFLDVQHVKRLVVETANGSFGILPNRLDGVAALAPGIITYEITSGEIKYIAIDQGIFVKEGKKISISVRNANAGSSLGLMHEAVDKQFVLLDKQENDLRTSLAKLESGFIQQFRKLTHG